MHRLMRTETNIDLSVALARPPAAFYPRCAPECPLPEIAPATHCMMCGGTPPQGAHEIRQASQPCRGQCRNDEADCKRLEGLAVTGAAGIIQGHRLSCRGDGPLQRGPAVVSGPGRCCAACLPHCCVCDGRLGGSTCCDFNDLAQGHRIESGDEQSVLDRRCTLQLLASDKAD